MDNYGTAPWSSRASGQVGLQDQTTFEWTYSIQSSLGCKRFRANLWSRLRSDFCRSGKSKYPENPLGSRSDPGLGNRANGCCFSLYTGRYQRSNLRRDAPWVYDVDAGYPYHITTT